MVRKSKDGYLNINEVLSLSSIMFRMKSNALLLTIITTVSALAIGLLSLSYISYYSAEKSAKNNVPAHFAMTNPGYAEAFTKTLEDHSINYEKKVIEVIQADFDVRQILDANLNELKVDPNVMTLPVISDQSVKNLDLSEDESVFTGYNDLLQKFMTIKDSGSIKAKGKDEVIPLNYLGMRKEFLISSYFTSGGLPIAIVDESIFNRLKKDINPEIQKESSAYIGIDIQDEERLTKANDLFHDGKYNDNHSSRLDQINNQKMNMGLIMFIVGFLGLTFLITSGCILYFKQMDESEDEKGNYTILRKLGFTRGDLLKGIQIKQLYSFGIPLIVGLLHSYFAVQSGWFLFGTEVWTPMIIVMVLYTALYSIFGILSVLYYKKVIKESL
jgi:bacitracin transport system permease protein